MNHGLTPETVAAINGVFADCPEVEKAILYGSRAKGNFSPGSNIDLCLVGDMIDTAKLLELDNTMDDLPIPYKIDLAVRHQITNEELLDHIKRVGKVFYERES